MRRRVVLLAVFWAVVSVTVVVVLLMAGRFGSIPIAVALLTASVAVLVGAVLAGLGAIGGGDRPLRTAAAVALAALALGCFGVRWLTPVPLSVREPVTALGSIAMLAAAVLVAVVPRYRRR